jgi:hypothetical protein
LCASTQGLFSWLSLMTTMPWFGHPYLAASAYKLTYSSSSSLVACCWATTRYKQPRQDDHQYTSTIIKQKLHTSQ